MTKRATPFRASPVKDSGRAIALRLLPDETKALEHLAARDDRSLSSLCRRVIREWLRDQTAAQNTVAEQA